MTTEKVTVKFPKTPGACIDKLFQMRSERITFERKIKDMKETEKAWAEYIIQNFKKDKLDGAKGKIAAATIIYGTDPIVEDWDLFWAYVLKKKDSTLIQKRIAVMAVRERWDAEEQVPGIGSKPTVDLSLTKR